MVVFAQWRIWPFVRPVAEVGVLSALIRPAMRSTVCTLEGLRRAPNFHLSGDEAIRGKTGPAPSGAVLFGPFSWAYKKKDEEK